MVIAWALLTVVEAPLTETDPAPPAAVVDNVSAAPVKLCEPVKLMAAVVGWVAVRVIGAPAVTVPPPDTVMEEAESAKAPVVVIVPLLVSAEKLPVSDAAVIAPEEPTDRVG